jgi:hypothetical protein
MKTNGRGVESPRNPKDSVEGPSNCLESTLEIQEMKWRRSEGVRLRRGMNPLYISCSPEAAHVRLLGRIYPVYQICLGQEPDISGDPKLEISRALGHICTIKGRTCLVILG